jgi:phenylacetate-coenzyme A ligase PaaK-like adenylate-forming protein
MIRKLREFKRNARMTRAQFEAMKLAKFRKLVEHANQHSSYYAELIKERKIDISTCQPGDFPVLTKSTLMANFDRIVTDPRITKQRLAEFLTHSTEPNDLYLKEYQVIHTSGSSGEVGYFVYSQIDWTCAGAQVMRRRSSPNDSPRRKRKSRGRFRAAFYGAIGGHYAGVSGASMAKRGIAKWFVNMQLYEVNSPLPQVIEQLNAFQPDVVSGYTTALKILAGKQKEGLLRISPVAIGTTGEAMTLADKAILEDAFGCEASSMYGCTEHLTMGVSTPGGKSMILYDDDLHYEFFADHSLVTNLFNYTLPLIRYRMSDILRPVANSQLITPYIEIESLVGRTEMMPMFINRDGAEDFISPHTINELFVAGVTRFQMHLLSNTSFRFMVCLDSLLNPSQRAAAVNGMDHRLRQVLDQKLMNNVTFDVIATDDLPVNPKTRKFNLIIDAREKS